MASKDKNSKSKTASSRKNQTGFVQKHSGEIAVLLIVSIAVNAYLINEVNSLNEKLTKTANTTLCDAGGATLGGQTIKNTQTKEINSYILTDERCEKCDTDALLAKVKQLLPDVNFKIIDYSTQEGQRLYEKSKTKNLPAIFFDESIKNSQGYEGIKKYIAQAGEMLGLRIDAPYDPVCDPTQEHCSEQRCAWSLNCRQEIPAKLDLYIMSQCPYGNQAVNSMKEVLNAFKGLNFTVHYLGYYNNDTNAISSLHGKAEVEEDMRQICAENIYGKDNLYLKYIWCRNQNLSEDWKECALKNSLDPEKISSCTQGDEGWKLLTKEFKNSMNLEIAASPTWIANNKYKFNAVAADEIGKNLCSTNPGLKGCEKKLTNKSTTTAAGTCG